MDKNDNVFSENAQKQIDKACNEKLNKIEKLVKASGFSTEAILYFLSLRDEDVKNKLEKLKSFYSDMRYELVMEALQMQDPIDYFFAQIEDGIPKPDEHENTMHFYKVMCFYVQTRCILDDLINWEQWYDEKHSPVFYAERAKEFMQDALDFFDVKSCGCIAVVNTVHEYWCVDENKIFVSAFKDMREADLLLITDKKVEKTRDGLRLYLLEHSRRSG